MAICAVFASLKRPNSHAKTGLCIDGADKKQPNPKESGNDHYKELIHVSPLIFGAALANRQCAPEPENWHNQKPERGKTMGALQLKKQSVNGFRTEDTGSIMIIFALGLPLFIGAIALGVEIGYHRFEKARLQNAADLAALAGAYESLLTTNESNIRLAAAGEAYENGFDYDRGSVNVITDITTGPYAGSDGVETILTRTQDRFFSRYFFRNEESTARNSFTLTARAVALTQTGEPACVVALSDVEPRAINLAGTSGLSLDQCGIHSNSSDPLSFNINGSATLTAACVSTTGGLSGEDNVTTTDCPAARQNQPRLPDPYADVNIVENVSALPCQSPTRVSRTVHDLRPGRYCGGFSLSGDVNLVDPGTYYFDGGTYRFQSSGTRLTGEGVTIVLMNGARLNLSNGGFIDLSAPSTGNFAGIVFYGDRNWPNQYDGVQITGNPVSRIDGAIYFPAQIIDYSGGGSTAGACTQLIGALIEVTGNVSITNDGCDQFGIRQIEAFASGVALLE